MSKSLDVMYSQSSDNWGTPIDLFNKYNSLYKFTLDGAADEKSHLVDSWLGPGSDIAENALEYHPTGERIWLNPPYSMCKEFVQWAWQITVSTPNFVCMLIPARTDTKYFHQYIYNQWGVEYVFLKGRLKFTIDGVPSKNSAPFPSVIVTFGYNPTPYTGLY